MSLFTSTLPLLMPHEVSLSEKQGSAIHFHLRRDALFQFPQKGDHVMTVTRREFLAISGVVGAGLALSSLGLDMGL
jgi:hypothetical protein